MKNKKEDKKIAYLGPPGTFSHLAAKTYDKNAVLLPFATIKDSAQALEKKEVNTAILPKENSTEGSINQTLDLLISSKLYITCEISLPIHHQLLSFSRSLEDVKTIFSHPQPLAQCQKWIKNNVPQAELLATYSTSVAVKYMLKAKEKSVIASSFASEKYDIPILARNIEDNPLNTTRFVELKLEKNTPARNLKKTSILFSMPDKVGALVKILNLFEEVGINLNKLESRPSVQKKFDYFFFIDFAGSEYHVETQSCLKKIKERCDFYKFLGSYDIINF